MPFKDGTGPAGKGPGTGRGLGNCQSGRSSAGLGGQAAQNRPLRRNRVTLGSWLGRFFRRRRDRRTNRT